MTVVTVDTTNPANFKHRKPIPAGSYVFEIGNKLVVEKAKSSENNIIKVELRCMDDGEHKGSVVFDNVVLTQKAEFKLCHLVLAAGTQTKEEMASGIELELLTGATVEADIIVDPPRRDPVTGQQYEESNRVKRYLFSVDEDNAAREAVQS